MLKIKNNTDHWGAQKMTLSGLLVKMEGILFLIGEIPQCLSTKGSLCKTFVYNFNHLAKWLRFCRRVSCRSSANKVMWSDRFVTNYSKNIKDRFAWKLHQVGLILRDWSK